MLAEQKDLEKELDALKGQAHCPRDRQCPGHARSEVCGVRVLVTEVAGQDMKALREYGEPGKGAAEVGCHCFGSSAAGNAQVIAMVTKDVAKRFSAKKIIEQVAPIIEGRGGGKDEMAQAGGKNWQAR